MTTKKEKGNLCPTLGGHKSEGPVHSEDLRRAAGPLGRSGSGPGGAEEAALVCLLRVHVTRKV